MKLLQLDSGHEMRGGQWQALQLHRGLLERGHESLLLAHEDSPLRQMALKADLPCDVLRPLRIGALSRGFDLVHAHDARSHTVGALFSRAPLVVSRRVAFPVRTSAISGWKYGRARMFLAVSKYVAAQLRRAGVVPERIAIVYDGVRVPAEPARGDAVLVPETLDPQKGMALARQAAAIAGIGLRASKNLEMDLPKARALVYLTYSEGLGSGILLAMAHGVTVIASNVGGIPEMIEDGRSGILVPNEPGSVGQALLRIDQALGKNAREIVMARFTLERMIESTLAAYAKALSNG